MGAKNKQKGNGLLWSVIITWLDFPLLYWGVMSENNFLLVVGFSFLVLGTGLAVFYG
ncbi:MAG: hypothetical protein ACOCV3_00045 [Halanaerobiales bacterium]